MEERINVIVRREGYPELYDFLAERKSSRTTYLDVLDQLVKDNEELRKQNVKQNDWTAIRLALRAIEKNSHLTVELLNNYFLKNETEPISSHDWKSKNLLKFERDWKSYIEGLQQERWSHHPKSLPDFEHKQVGSKLEMPPFDFGEENI